MTMQIAASFFWLWYHKDTGSPSFLPSWAHGWMPWSGRQSPQFLFQASSPIFHGLCWSWTQPSVWTLQIQGKNRPLAERAGFPQSALSPNSQSKWCWPGLKASQLLLTSTGQHKGGPGSTIHGQFCYFIPSHSSNIRFPFSEPKQWNRTKVSSRL